MVDVCGDFVALGDYMGTKIYVLNSEGFKGEIETTLAVQRFCVAGNGNVAVVLEEDDVTWVKLFNVNGEDIANDRTTMAKSGYPISIDISEDGILLSVSYLYIDSGEISSSVAYYNFGSVGQNEIDNLVSGYNYPDEVITYTGFMNNDTSFALGSSHLEIFKGDQKPENVADIELDDEVSGVFYGKNNIGLVYATGTLDAPYEVDVYDKDGQLVLSQPFDLEYTDIVFNKDLVIIYNSSECVIYNLEGVQKYKGLFKNSILDLISTSTKTKYLLVSGGKTDEIQLR